MMLLMVAGAWITAFLPMPRWLSIVLSIAILLAGTVLVVSGGLAYWWDSSMRADQSDSLHALIAGIALLLSRAKLVLRVIAEILVAV